MIYIPLFLANTDAVSLIGQVDRRRGLLEVEGGDATSCSSVVLEATSVIRSAKNYNYLNVN